MQKTHRQRKWRVEGAEGKSPTAAKFKFESDGQTITNNGALHFPTLQRRRRRRRRREEEGDTEGEEEEGKKPSPRHPQRRGGWETRCALRPENQGSTQMSTSQRPAMTRTLEERADKKSKHQSSNRMDPLSRLALGLPSPPLLAVTLALGTKITQELDTENIVLTNGGEHRWALVR